MNRDANGIPTYRSNWSPAVGADVNTNYAMGNSTMNAAAFGVWSPIIWVLYFNQLVVQGYNAGICCWRCCWTTAAATG